ncbi:hypothetical protein E3P77_03189 [Wallemia ichthyophaga]|nr:hypothetical protein E3P77_03189 [Wallemia ichthyophaga]
MYTHHTTPFPTHADLLRPFYMDLTIDAIDTLTIHPKHTHNWGGVGHTTYPSQCQTRSPTQYNLESYPVVDITVASPSQDDQDGVGEEDEEKWLAGMVSGRHSARGVGHALGGSESTGVGFGSQSDTHSEHVVIVRRGPLHSLQLQQAAASAAAIQRRGRANGHAPAHTNTPARTPTGDDGLFGSVDALAQLQAEQPAQPRRTRPQIARRDSFTCVPLTSPAPGSERERERGVVGAGVSGSLSTRTREHTHSDHRNLNEMFSQLYLRQQEGLNRRVGHGEYCGYYGYTGYTGHTSHNGNSHYMPLSNPLPFPLQLMVVRRVQIGDGMAFDQLVQFLLRNSPSTGMKGCSDPCNRCIGINRRKMLQHIRHNLAPGGCARRILATIMGLFEKCLTSGTITLNTNCFQMRSGYVNHTCHAYHTYHTYKINYVLTEEFRRHVALAKPLVPNSFVYV